MKDTIYNTNNLSCYLELYQPRIKGDMKCAVPLKMYLRRRKKAARESPLWRSANSTTVKTINAMESVKALPVMYE